MTPDREAELREADRMVDEARERAAALVAAALGPGPAVREARGIDLFITPRNPMARRPDLPFGHLAAAHGRDLADLDDQLRREFNLTAGGVFHLKEIAWRIGVDRIPDLTDEQLEAEAELHAKRMVPGQVTGLALPIGADGPREPLVERVRRDAQGSDLEFPSETIGFLRRIAQEYVPVSGA